MSGKIEKSHKITPIENENVSLASGSSVQQGQNSVLENELNFGQFDGLEVSNGEITQELEAKVAELLGIKYTEIAQKLEKAENNSGLIGSAWSSIKNTKLFDRITDSSNDIQKALDEAAKVESDSVKTRFETVTGVEYNRQNVESFLQGKLKTKSEQALSDFNDGQELAKDLGGDLLSGITSGITYTAVGGATVVGLATGSIAFTAALPIVAGAVLAAGTVGALTKVVVKAFEASAENNKYETLTKDAVTGAITGALSPLVALGMGKIAGSIVTKMGGSVATSAATSATTTAVTKATTEILEETSEQVVKKGTNLVMNLSGNTYQGSNLIKAIGYSTEFAGQGAIVGAADAGARTSIDGGDAGDITNATIQGLGFGAVGGLAFGWGFKGLSNLAHGNAPKQKTYNIEVPNRTSTSGKLYSGLPIPELVKVLGKNSKAVTVDDVVEEYLKQRFLTLKYTLADGSYERVINSPNGSQNPLMSLEISPRTFVEDVLFNDNTIAEVDAFAFYNFKRKFNIEDLKAGIEFILDSYQPPSKAATVNPVRVRQGNTNSPSTSTQGKAASVDVPASEGTIPPSGKSGTEGAGSGKGSKAQGAAIQGVSEPSYVQLQTVRGRKPQYEDTIQTILEKFKAENKVEIYNEIAKVYNKFCGVNRKGNEDLAKAFADELAGIYAKHSTLNDDAYRALTKKYSTSNISIKSPNVNDNEGVSSGKSAEGKTKKGSKNNTAQPSTANAELMNKLKNVAKSLFETDLFSGNQAFIDGTITDDDIANLAALYVKNAIRSQKGFTQISDLTLPPEKILKMLLTIKNSIKGLDEIPDAKLKGFNMSRVQADIKKRIQDFRVMFVEAAIKSTEDDGILVDDLLKCFDDMYGWKLTEPEFTSITKYVNVKKRYTELFDLVKSKISSAKSPADVDMNDMANIEFIVDILNKNPDFDFDLLFRAPNVRKLTDVAKVYERIPEACKSEFLEFLEKRSGSFDPNAANKWLMNGSKIQHLMSFMDYLYLNSYGIPDEKMFSFTNQTSILDVLNVPDRGKFKNFIMDKCRLLPTKKGEPPKLIDCLNKMFELFDAQNLDELSEFLSANNIEKFVLKIADPKTNKYDIDIDFSNQEVDLSEGLQRLARIYSKINGDIVKKSSPAVEVNEENMLQEIAFRIEREIIEKRKYFPAYVPEKDKNFGFGGYSNLIKILSNDDESGQFYRALMKNYNSFTKSFNYEGFIKDAGNLYDKNKAAQVCANIQHEALDLFEGLHSKLRFYERFYKYNVSEALNKLKNLFNGNVRITKYYNDHNLYDNSPRCTVLDPESGGAVSMTLNENGLIHTLFFKN